IELAKECSVILSSLALLFTSLLAGHLLLRSAGRKTALALVTVPLLMIKNGIRIVTLSTLAIYADPSFLTGKLHSEGGFVFFLLALAVLAPVLWFLQRAVTILCDQSSHRCGRRSVCGHWVIPQCRSV